MVLVSLSFMTAVAAVPAHDRPYVDGSCDNSIFSQVFLYNGIDRFAATRVYEQGCSPPTHFLVEAGKVGAALGLGTSSIPPGLGRLLHGPFGRDDAWIVIPSVAAAAGVLLSRRRRARTDPLRAAALLWSGWAVLTWVFFSEGRYLNSYYLAALMPALAALCGLGGAAAWRHRHAAATRLTVLLTVVASTAYGLTLVPAAAGIRSWILASVVIAAALAVGILAASLRRQHASLWTITCGLALSAAALISSSAWASGSVVVAGEGPFDTPYQSSSITNLSQVLPAFNRAQEWPLLVRFADATPPGVAGDVLESSYFSSDDIFATGHEFLPVGGFTGQVPAPPLPQFIHYVATGKVVAAQAAVAPRSHNPDIIWVIDHCTKQAEGDATFSYQGTTVQRYICQRSQGLKAERAERAEQPGGAARAEQPGGTAAR
jgi:4-amino-4-deoxy-L-arabinose transferase-like glycosyltransferase